MGSIEKIERAMVLYLIVAWRIARIMRLGRGCPDLDAQLMFEPDEWTPAYENTSHSTHAQRGGAPGCQVGRLSGAKG